MHHHRPPPATLLFCGALTAQLPDWVPYPVTNPTRSFEEAHILVVQDSSAVHVFSTYTRRWATQPTTSPTAQFFGYDDHAVVQDGNTFYGFAVRYGVFVPLHTNSASPFVTNLPSTAILTVVIDGNDMHAFSPFTGRWSTLHVNSNGSIATGKMVAVFSDGNTVYGYSPLFGQFVPLQTAATVTSSGAGGYCGYATDGQAHYAFSSVHDTWTTLPSAAGAHVTVGIGRHGHLILDDGLTVDLYSAFSGQCTRIPVTQPPIITASEQIVVVADAPITYLWSAVTDSMAMHVSASQPMVTATPYIGALQDGQDLYMFSAATGSFAPVLHGNWNASFSDSVAVASDASGANTGYSALLNRWVPGPNGSFGATLTQNGAILLDTGGFLHGFSARTGTWSSIATGSVDSARYHGSSYCARAGNDLYAYNERYGHWAHTTTTSPARLTTKRETVLADYGSEAQAYCIWNDHWSTVQLSSPAITVLVSDDSALVQDSNGLHGFGGSCQVSTWGLYPEWWRFMTRGTLCPIHVAGEPGAGAILALSLNTTALTIPGIAGQLGVDLTHAALLFGIVPSEGMWVVPATIPDVPGLVGLTLQTQALLLPPAGPYFTTVFPTTIL